MRNVKSCNTFIEKLRHEQHYAIGSEEDAPPDCVVVGIMATGAIKKRLFCVYFYFFMVDDVMMITIQLLILIEKKVLV